MDTMNTDWMQHYIDDLEWMETCLSEQLEQIQDRLTDLRRPVIDGLTTRIPGVMSGALCIAGTRISVDAILTASASGWDAKRMTEAWPAVGDGVFERIVKEYGG